MSKALTINDLNEALARQTVTLLDMMDQRLDRRFAEFEISLDNKLNNLTLDLTEQIHDMMAHIDNRFNKLETITYRSDERLDNHEGRISKLERVTDL